MKYASFALALSLGLSAIGPSAQAQLLDGNAAGTVQVTSTGTGFGVFGDMDASVAEIATTSGDAVIETEAEVAPIEPEASSRLDFSFSKGTFAEGDEYSFTDISGVQNSVRLKNYAATKVQDDAKVRSIALAGEQMTMTYRKDARLLWVLPLGMNVDVSIQGDGAVAADYPWYAFLMAAGESEAELEARLNAEAVAAVAETPVQGGLSSSTDADTEPSQDEVRRWAVLLDRILIALQGDAAAEASVEG